MITSNEGASGAARVGAAATARPAGLPDGISLFSVYQPIVTIDAFEVVAYAAFARGRRSGVPLMMSDLLQTAGEALDIADFDRLCREVAVGDYDRIDVDGVPLFVKTLPSALASLDTERWWGDERTTVVLEVSATALADIDPAVAARELGALAAAGVLLALDRVGTGETVRELISRVNPAVVKLDRRLVHDFDAGVARELAGFLADCAARGITVAAEGVETAEHAERAVRLGATCGQGYYFGWPSALPAPLPRSSRPGLVGIAS